MKISDIVVENAPFDIDAEDQERLNRLRARGGVHPEEIRLTQQYLRTGHDYVSARSLASDKYKEKQQQQPQKKRQQDPSKLTPKDKDTVARRISQFGTVGTDAASQAKGKIAQAWQRGGRWSRALGVPSPKKS